ncbi:GGDEF domain-containing protein [Vibrio sinensis]|uniref:diguanylate cyclase n=2 Tax=Vibrio sinensis TaxID=2302434 RepID=A0A3A6QCU8_9VIBR|nr:GGDEF domain-containing protein [Vibrio sinensis]
MILILGFITTVLVLLYWSYGHTKTMTVSPKKFSYLADNDQIQRGRSVTSLTVTNDTALLQCELKPSPNFKWPYCGLSIQVNNDPTIGIDLSDYHTVRLNVDFERLDSHDLPTMRFYLRNFNPEYSVRENEYSYKYSGLEFTPERSNPIVDISMHDLQVKPWWIIDNNIAAHHSAPEFSNITIIELSTGAGSHYGEYQMEIRGIEFVGHYISGQYFILLLLFIWVVSLTVFFIVNSCRSHKLILNARTRQEHLHNLIKAIGRRNAEFTEFGYRDTLTGAMNRKAIWHWLEQNFEVDLYQERDLSAIFINIDHFKKINDHFGQKVTNDILKEFTLVILELLKPTHQLARWESEEFVVFCPDTPLEEAIQLAEVICEKIEIYVWAHKSTLTASLGVTSLGDERTNDMLVRAGEALHLAKHNGCNRVEVGIAIP